MDISLRSVSNCLAVDPLWLIPKIAVESGFHIQIQNPKGDAGLGQITKPALKDIDPELPRYRKQIESSTNPSCQWLTTQIKDPEKFWRPLVNESKCTLMTAPANPIRSLLLIAILHQLNTRYIEKEFQRLNVDSLLQEAGLQDVPVRRVQNLLLALGYNTGATTAVRNLHEFLKSRIDFIKRKSREFSSKQLKTMTTADKVHMLSFATPKDFDFTLGVQKFHDRKKQIRQQLSLKNSVTAESEVEKAMRNISASQYSFPEWLLVWQSTGGPGYVSALARFAQETSEMKCSNPAYYRIDSN